MLSKYFKEILLESEVLEPSELTSTLEWNYLPLQISCFHTPSFLACFIAMFSCSSSAFLCAPVCCLTQEGWRAFSPLWELCKQNRLQAAGLIPVGHFARQWWQEWPWSMTELSLNNLIDERILLFTLWSHLLSPNIWHQVINTHTVKREFLKKLNSSCWFKISRTYIEIGADQHRAKKGKDTLVFCDLTVSWKLQDDYWIWSFSHAIKLPPILFITLLSENQTITVCDLYHVQHH